MMSFFRRSKRSKTVGSHPQPPGRDNPGRDKKPHPMSFKKRGANTDYIPYQKQQLKSNRPGSTQANKGLVNKMKEVNATNPVSAVPDVIASHETRPPTQVVRAQINVNRSQASHEGPRVISKEIKQNLVEKPTQSSVVPTIKEESQADTEKLNVTSDEAKKRTSSFTHSENEAVATLDDMLRTFDLDDNFNEVRSEASGHTSLILPAAGKGLSAGDGDFLTEETHYSTINELREKEIPKKGNIENASMPSSQPEPVYAKPVKKKKTPAEEIGLNQSGLKSSGKDEVDTPPAIPPKRFETPEEPQIKFSPLKKTPSASLSQSLKKTDWANANGNLSPKRRPKEDNNNNNYSLKRGKLSKLDKSNTGEELPERPHPDYDKNGTLTSLGKATNVSDDSFIRDTYNGSLTSSSISESEKVRKSIRPEVLEVIKSRKKKQQKESEQGKERRHDSLVDRSFRLTRNSSLKENIVSETSSGDYEAIKNEADKWLASSERLRANSQGKKNELTETSSSNSSPIRTVQGNRNVRPGNRSTNRKVEEKEGSPEIKPKPALQSEVTRKSKKTQPKTAPAPSQRAQKKPKRKSSKQDDDSSDDENLVRLMETGNLSEDSSDVVNDIKELRTGYVPRALRMSFGQSWDGIRKDRRTWKSREMSAMVSSRRPSTKLSNRLDEQNQELEMLF